MVSGFYKEHVLESVNFFAGEGSRNLLHTHLLTGPETLVRHVFDDETVPFSYICGGATGGEVTDGSFFPLRESGRIAVRGCNGS